VRPGNARGQAGSHTSGNERAVSGAGAEPARARLLGSRAGSALTAGLGGSHRPAGRRWTAGAAPGGTGTARVSLRLETATSSGAFLTAPADGGAGAAVPRRAQDIDAGAVAAALADAAWRLGVLTATGIVPPARLRWPGAETEETDNRRTGQEAARGAPRGDHREGSQERFESIGVHGSLRMSNRSWRSESSVVSAVGGVKRVTAQSPVLIPCEDPSDTRSPIPSPLRHQPEQATGQRPFERLPIR
jgi:hypothetical protein